MLTRTGRTVPLGFRRGTHKAGVVLKHVVGVNESVAHMAAGVAGLGIVQTFGFAAKAHLESGRLVEILENWKPPPHPFYVVYPPNHHLSHRLRVFIDWIVKRFANLDA